jgi:hypothetical protein
MNSSPKKAAYIVFLSLTAFATEYVFDCGDCDVTDPIDVNIW